MIILASQSQTRQSLLKNAGLNFVSVRPDYNEHEGRKLYSPTSGVSLALHLAFGKANSMDQVAPGNLVIAADQTLECDAQFFTKPKTMEEARHQLLALRAKTHTLCSAVACRDSTGIVWHEVAIADVTMLDYTEKHLNTYLEMVGHDILGSVGSYNFEGPGIQLISSVVGDYHTILGLPLLPLLSFLRHHRYITK